MEKQIKKKYMLIGLLSVLLCIMLGILFLITLPALKVEKSVNVQVNSKFDPLSIVEKVRDGSIEDVKVDTKKLNLKKVGEYTIIYKLHDEEYEVEVNVVDEKAPVFDVVKGESDAGIELDPASLVKNVKDDSKTTVSFKKKVNFKKEGVVDCIVVVKDAYGNEAEKETTIKIYPKDEIAPVIKGDKKVSINVGMEFDPLNLMSVSDNQTKNIKLKVVKNTVDTSKEGTYYVEYEAVDRSLNKATFKKEVKVIKRRATFGGENVVYLTFDDGPSYITPKILDILDRYNVKATFFVVGFNANYFNYIKEAYDRGHTIALHTYSHDYSIYSSSETYFNDLNRISDLVYDLIGYRSPYIRFPGGSSNMISSSYATGIMSKLTQEVRDKGYQYYDWNVSSADASGNGVPASTIIDSATNCSGGTAMILFHDANGKETTVEALPAIIEHYLNLGYTFKGIDETTSGFHHGVNN